MSTLFQWVAHSISVVSLITALMLLRRKKAGPSRAEQIAERLGKNQRNAMDFFWIETRSDMTEEEGRTLDRLWIVIQDRDRAAQKSKTKPVAAPAKAIPKTEEEPRAPWAE